MLLTMSVALFLISVTLKMADNSSQQEAEFRRNMRMLESTYSHRGPGNVGKRYVIGKAR